MVYSVFTHACFLTGTHRYCTVIHLGMCAMKTPQETETQTGAQLWCNDSRMLRFLNVWLVLCKQTFSIESAPRPSKKGFCLRRRGWMWGIVKTERRGICWEFWPITCHLLFMRIQDKWDHLAKWAFLHQHHKFVTASQITTPCQRDLRVFCRTACLHIIWHVVLSFPGQGGCLLWASTSTDLNPYSQSFVPEVLSLRTNIHSCINLICLVHFLKMQDCKTAVVFPP